MLAKYLALTNILGQSEVKVLKCQLKSLRV